MMKATDFTIIWNEMHPNLLCKTSSTRFQTSLGEFIIFVNLCTNLELNFWICTYLKGDLQRCIFTMILNEITCI
jgi:hypothetical protein